MTQFVMVDQVPVAERDPDNPLHHQRLGMVLDVSRMACIGEAAGSGSPDQTPSVCAADGASSCRRSEATTLSNISVVRRPVFVL